jgi:DHA2 family multidrug resistance protein
MKPSAAKISAATRGLIIIAVMSATLIQVLDTTIVNVALPHMQGSLGATADETTWVLTSYLVASAIFMPLTGYFTDRLGRRKYLLISIAGFVAASILCGAAVNITQIVLFRLLQGVFGAALVPLSQAIMTDIFPEEERGTAMAIWGMGVMIGPILGPTLGGYLTDIATWRWNFYINIPVGILSFLLAWRVVPDTPKQERRMDWTGLILISTAIGSLQYFLDRGNQDDWLNSTSICIAAFLAIICFLGFLLHALKEKQHTVFDIRIFNDRNFTIASLLLSMLGLGLYGAMVISPLMMENLFNYPVLTTGLAMAPRGISGMISMYVVGKLIRHIDPRWLTISGICISGTGMYFGTYYNLTLSPAWIIGPFLLQGFGLGMIFVPLSAIAFSTLPAKQRSEAAGLFSLLRTLGSSVGISIIITLFSRHTQMAWNQLGGFINPYNPAVTKYLAPLHITIAHPLAARVLAKELAAQAQMMSFVDVYVFITGSFLIMIPLVLLLKKARKKPAEDEEIIAHME